MRLDSAISWAALTAVMILTGSSLEMYVMVGVVFTAYIWLVETYYIAGGNTTNE